MVYMNKKSPIKTG